MSSWQDKAIKALEDSLHPVPQELKKKPLPDLPRGEEKERTIYLICAICGYKKGSLKSRRF